MSGGESHGRQGSQLGKLNNKKGRVEADEDRSCVPTPLGAVGRMKWEMLLKNYTELRKKMFNTI